MRGVTLCVVAAVVVAFSPAQAWAQGDRPSQAAWFCHSKPDVNPVYVSSVWDKAEIHCTAGINVGGRPGQMVAETYLSAPFDAGDTSIPAQKAAVEKFLRSKYGITSESLSSYCQGMVDETQALPSIKTWTTRANATGKAIDTGWKLGK